MRVNFNDVDVMNWEVRYPCDNINIESNYNQIKNGCKFMFNSGSIWWLLRERERERERERKKNLQRVWIPSSCSIEHKWMNANWNLIHCNAVKWSRRSRRSRRGGNNDLGIILDIRVNKHLGPGSEIIRWELISLMFWGLVDSTTGFRKFKSQRNGKRQTIERVDLEREREKERKRERERKKSHCNCAAHYEAI